MGTACHGRRARAFRCRPEAIQKPSNFLEEPFAPWSSRKMERSPAISFLEFRIDPVAGELLRDGERVAVEPQVLDLISYLAARPQRLITKDELIENVWGGRIVSDSAIAVIHYGEAATLREFAGKEIWRGRGNLRGIISHGFSFKELPSLAIPAYFGILLPLLFVSALLTSNLNWLGWRFYYLDICFALLYITG